MDFSFKSAIDFFLNAAPKKIFQFFVVSLCVTLLFVFFPDLLPDWPAHVGAIAFWSALVSGLMLLGSVLWEGFEPARREVIRWKKRRKEIKTLRKLTLDEVAVVSVLAQCREKELPMEKHNPLAQSLESKGIIKRTFSSLLAETSAEKQSWYSPPDPPEFEVVATVWALIVNMDEFKVDAEALLGAIQDGKKGEALQAYLSPKHPTVFSTK